MPPYNANYQTDTTLTTGWASIVFHCGDTAGTRIACGNLVKVSGGSADSSPCNFDGDAWVENESCSNDDDGINMKWGTFAVVITILVVGWAMALFLCALRFLFTAGAHGDTAKLTSSV